MGVSQATVDIMNDGVSAGSKETFLSRLHRSVHDTLAPGEDLNAMTAEAVRLFDESLSAIAEQKSATVHLYDWARRTVIPATTTAVYGPANPFLDPGILDAWTQAPPTRPRPVPS